MESVITTNVPTPAVLKNRLQQFWKTDSSSFKKPTPAENMRLQTPTPQPWKQLFLFEMSPNTTESNSSSLKWAQTQLCRPSGDGRVYRAVGLRHAWFSGRRPISRPKIEISQEQNVKEFQFCIRIPNFRLLGSIIKKKYPKVVDPLKGVIECALHSGVYKNAKNWMCFEMQKVKVKWNSTYFCRFDFKLKHMFQKIKSRSFIWSSESFKNNYFCSFTLLSKILNEQWSIGSQPICSNDTRFLWTYKDYILVGICMRYCKFILIFMSVILNLKTN